MNILAVGSHPDDIELGCGGTLLKYSIRGDNVYYLILTDGSAGGDAALRKREQQRTADLLGVKRIYWGDFKDAQLTVHQNIINYIEGVIKEVQPDTIFVNYYDDSHQDHRAAAKCTISAARHVKRILFYEDYTSLNFQPDIFVDIEKVLDKKIDILKLHFSQVSKQNSVAMNLLESVSAVANFRGFQAKVRYAEGFKAARYLME